MNDHHTPRPPRRVRAAIAAACLIDGYHTCPVEDCDEKVSPGHVGCLRHWRAVPGHLRRPLIEAFRMRRQNYQAYVKACDAAVDLIQLYATVPPDA